MTATDVPAFASVRRLLPARVAEAVLPVLIVVAYLATGSSVWFLTVPMVAVALLVWIVYLLRAHRDEWRWATEDQR